MKFRFDDQPHQAAATDAVVDLFEGALAPPAHVLAGTAPGAEGHAGFGLNQAVLAANLKRVTQRERVDIQDTLMLMAETDLRETEREFPNFSVEMETGTGKTYVYIATALRMAEAYGLRKFVILVHSVAIRAGVVKTFRDTYEHFRAKFPSLAYQWSVMGESRALDDFAEPGGKVQFLIASVQLLDKPDTNTLYSSPEQPRIWGATLSGVEQVAQTRPVVLIDEPQNMASPLRRRVIATLNPLVALRYSATHREPFNLVHRLGPKRAAEAGLVKRVSVKGIVAGSTGQPYMHFKKIVARRGRPPFAEFVIDKAKRDGAERAEVVLEVGSDLFAESGGLTQYRGLVVDNITRTPDQVMFENGLVLAAGAKTGVDPLAIWRDQVRQTIRIHLQTQKAIDASGHAIKVLSLFFVERVADYDGTAAVLPAMFDTIFREEWARAGLPGATPDPAQLRVAYFPSTKTGIKKDTKGGNKSDAELEERAYKEIIEQKELLLDRSNPRAFIFSHSALREGWDNPNVFQIGFLRHSGSETERRQQIGRGLRLPVNQDGDRVADSAINRLTLVVDESFSEFVRGLNEEVLSAGGQSDDRADVENADNIVEIRRRPEKSRSPEFAELWNRIRYKAAYRVSVSQAALVASLARSEHLEELKYINQRANVVQSADLVYDENGLVVTSDQAVSVGAGERLVVAGQRLPNVVRLVEDHLLYGKFPLQLTRATVVALLKAVPEIYQAKAIEDPDRWSRIVAHAIRVVAVEDMINNITYEPMDEASWWDANVVFVEVEQKNALPPQAREPDAGYGVAPAPTGGANLFDHVEYDSRVELNFSQQLEADPGKIKLFTKLPRRFKVRTPVGEYSPDWAIVCDGEAGDRLYLVRETKDTVNLDDLEWDEAMRIRFARAHFKAAPKGPVNFTWTTDRDGLKIS